MPKLALLRNLMSRNTKSNVLSVGPLSNPLKNYASAIPEKSPFFSCIIVATYMPIVIRHSERSNFFENGSVMTNYESL